MAKNIRIIAQAMEKKIDLIKSIVPNSHQAPICQEALAFAPSNIALCKYWGKRCENLHLPVTDSLSISLSDRGASTRINIINSTEDEVYLNGQRLPLNTSFATKVIDYLDLFRSTGNEKFLVQTTTNIPVAAGIASSACGFAAMAMCLQKIYGFDIDSRKVSILARIGSGSASRSIWQGFVKWHRGHNPNGVDSFAEPLPFTWQNLCIGLLLIETTPKSQSSRAAMRNCVATSPFYAKWPEIVSNDMHTIEKSIQEQNFTKLGETVEANARYMHALMLSTTPSVIYSTSKTLQAMQTIWEAREHGLPVYYTQDAGANLKLIFEEQNLQQVKQLFPTIQVIRPFSLSTQESENINIKAEQYG